MALKRFTTSSVRSLRSVLLEVSLAEALSDVPEVLAESAISFSSVVSAVCAPEILLLESEEETLERNSPSGLLELTLEGRDSSTWLRYCCASVVFPELMAEMRLESAVSNELWLLEELDVEEVEDALRLEIRELALCKLVMDMNGYPFQKFLRNRR
jgi:hypothetical protein